MARIEELSVRAGEIELAATLTLPDAPPRADRRGRYPNVLLLGSWLPRSRDGGPDRVRHPAWFATDDAAPGLLARLADALAALGVASLRCDPRGCAASGGSWTDAALFTRIDDARDALGAMRGRRDLDLSRTGIVGHGEGATIAMSVAIADPAVGALTLVGAHARSFRDVLRRAVATRARSVNLPAHPILAALDRWSEDLIERADRGEPSFELAIPGAPSATLGLDGLRQAFATPPRALVTMLDRSVTVVHGSDDAWVAADEADLLLAARPPTAPRARRVEIAAGHDLSEASDAVVAELAADLAARLAPRRLPPVLVAIAEMG